MKQFRLEATPAVELDIEAAFNWYEVEEAGLGFEFLEELRSATSQSTEGAQENSPGHRPGLTSKF